MMNIGEFAALTGLSVKALHHYGERGVLAQRQAEDQAFERAQSLLRSLAQPVEVTEVNNQWKWANSPFAQNCARSGVLHPGRRSPKV